MAVVLDPAQMVREGMLSTLGDGFTVTVKLSGEPKQPLNSELTVNSEVITELPVLMAENDGIFPLPEVADSPMELLLLVQLKLAPCN